ncbi:MAG TPA: hypothetical protein PK322_06745, partial [Opitutaceae bacterium]|nr:hypothetical protein [Opitutaceae bacterium]
WGGRLLLESLVSPAWWRDIVVLATGIPLGVASYGAVLWGLRIEGRAELPALAGRLVARLGLRRG